MPRGVRPARRRPSRLRRTFVAIGMNNSSFESRATEPVDNRGLRDCGRRRLTGRILALALLSAGVAASASGVASAQELSRGLSWGDPGAFFGNNSMEPIAMPTGEDSPVAAEDARPSSKHDAKTHGCDAGAVQFAVGRAATPELIETIKLRSKAQFMRVLPEGTGATRDFIPSRVNIHLDADSRIVAIGCG